LLEDAIQSIDVHWLYQMRNEACILCADEIFIHAITAERDPAQAVVNCLLRRERENIDFRPLVAD